jgi:isopentenyl-diphosphate delta-isomerase type 1
MPQDSQNELFVVVDKCDTIVGYRTRFECHSDKTLIHRDVGIVIFNDHGEVLLQKRSIKKDTDPGFFTLSASGHVAKGETYRKAAIRELFEEIGIRARLKKVKTFLVEYPFETEMETLFTANHNGPFIIDDFEVDSVTFVKPENIKLFKDKLTLFALESFKILGFL